MKKLILTFVTVAVVATIVGLVGCGKSDNNNNSNQVATTPADCYNQGLNPAYYGQPNQWQPYNSGYQQPGYQNQWNPNNVGCVANQPSIYNNYQQYYQGGYPYYVIPNQQCAINSPYNSCPVGTVCQAQAGMYYYTWQIGYGGLRRTGICQPIY